MADRKKRASRRNNKAEALVWLESGSAKDYRSVGELTNEQSVKLVRKLYRFGAEQVVAEKIQDDSMGKTSDSLIVHLPTDPNARAKIFEWSNLHAQSIGCDPDEDTGQATLLVWFD